MSYYRKKPVVIEAMNWDGSWDSMVTIKARWPEMRTTRLNSHTPSRKVLAWSIGTLEGPHEVSPGDYIIKGVKGEFYPCKPDIFALTYESADMQNCTSDDAADARRYRGMRLASLTNNRDFTNYLLDAKEPFTEAEFDTAIDAALDVMKQGGEV